MTQAARRLPARLLLALAMIAGTGLAAQDSGGGFVVSPLDPIDPADPADPVDPPDPQQGTPGFGRVINPDMGLVQTPLPQSGGGFVDGGEGGGGFVQVNPGGQDGVALVETRNLRASNAVTSVVARQASGARLRSLDRTVAQTTDFEMNVGETVIIGRLAVRLRECRYPADNPSSDAFAHLEIADLEGRALFDGWMIASSPALMALEHPRYDVWLLSCRTS